MQHPQHVKRCYFSAFLLVLWSDMFSSPLSQCPPSLCCRGWVIDVPKAHTSFLFSEIWPVVVLCKLPHLLQKEASLVKSKLLGHEQLDWYLQWHSLSTGAYIQVTGFDLYSLFCMTTQQPRRWAISVLPISSMRGGKKIIQKNVYAADSTLLFSTHFEHTCVIYNQSRYMEVSIGAQLQLSN